MASDAYFHQEQNGRVTVLESGGVLQIKSGGQIDASAAGSTGILLDPSLDQFVNVTITSAQLLALNATPITLVAAPGANKALIFLGAMVTKAAGTAYAGIAAGEDLAIKYTGTAGLEVGEVEPVGFLDQTTAQFRYITPVVQGTAPISSFLPVANAVLVAHMLVGEITTGTSDLKFRVFYRVVPTVL